MADETSTTATAEAPKTEKNKVEKPDSITIKATDGELVLAAKDLNNQQIKMLQDTGEYMDKSGLQGLFEAFTKRNAEVKPGRGRTAGPVVLEFSAKAAKVFAAKILENKDNATVAKEADIKVGNINITLADTALKVVRNMLKEGVVSPEQVTAILNAHGTAAEKTRKPRADKKQTDAGTSAANAPAESVNETAPAGTVELSEDELAAIAAAA